MTAPQQQPTRVRCSALERDTAREARAYAEAWWQALGDWQTHTREELVPRTSGSGGGFMVAVVGNYGRGQATLTIEHVYTPAGWLSARAVDHAIHTGDCAALVRLRKGTGLASLLDRGSRWQRGGQDAARQVLELAVQLGDTKAETYLPFI